MPKIIRFLAILAVLCLFIPGASSAGEEGLYPAAPPPGSVFVRFFNSGDTSAAVKIRDKSYGMAAPKEVTAYAPVPAGDAALSFNALTASFPLKENAHYIVMPVNGKLTVLEEPADDSKLKAKIILVNASSADKVSLKTADGATSVIDAVTRGSAAGRSVNAVNIPFSVYSATKKIDDISAQTLQRGARYAVIVYDGRDGKPAVVFN